MDHGNSSHHGLEENATGSHRCVGARAGVLESVWRRGREPFFGATLAFSSNIRESVTKQYLRIEFMTIHPPCASL
jgi:hypothetical protein